MSEAKKEKKEKDKGKDVAPADEASKLTPPSPEEAEALVRLFGLIYSNAILYGLSHKVTRKSVEDAFVNLSKALETFGEIGFHTTDEVMMVNGVPVEEKNPLTEGFVKHLGEIELPSFTILPGLAADKFADLVELLHAKPDELKQLGGFADVVAAANFEHVRAKKMVYKRIAEDDVVLSREKMARVATAGASDVQAVVSFLKGGKKDGAEKETVENLKRVAANSQEMGKLIVETAEARKAESGAKSDEKLADMVVDSLERIFKELSTDPSAKTQKGKKDLSRTLSSIEESVKQRIAEISGGMSPEDARAISESVESMSDQLKIDALVSEYMKKREAFDKNEERILKMIKAKGLDTLSDIELEQRLTAGGLSHEGWLELLAKSGIEITPGAIGTMPVVGHLAELLTHIQTSVGATATEGGATAEKKEDLSELVTRIDGEVKSLVDKTKVKIKGLIDDLKADKEVAEEAERRVAAEGKSFKMSRKKLFGVLAEIGQELCQPLAVINCSVDMIVSGSLGAVTEGQVSMLKLATESGQKLKVLIDNLIEISGLPASMAPDSGIQSVLYEKK